jgi:hypothetical protein
VLRSCLLPYFAGFSASLDPPVSVRADVSRGCQTINVVGSRMKWTSFLTGSPEVSTQITVRSDMSREPNCLVHWLSAAGQTVFLSARSSSFQRSTTDGAARL